MIPWLKKFSSIFFIALAVASGGPSVIRDLWLVTGHVPVEPNTEMWAWIRFCFATAFVIAFVQERRKVLAYERAANEMPQLEIVWDGRPDAKTYRMHYGVNGKTLHFRVAAVNKSTLHKVSNVKVRLTALEPDLMPCVPCCLRLMNDIHDSPEPYIERFELAPEEQRFVDVLAQDPDPNVPSFFLWHTVHRISVVLPKQFYRFTIAITGDNAKADSKSFELVEEGEYWEMKKAVQGDI